MTGFWLNLTAISAVCILSSLGSGQVTDADAAQFNKGLHELLPEAIKQSGIVKVAAPRQLPPNIYEEAGVLKGEAPDLMKAIEPILGVKFNFADVQWPGVLPGIQSGNYDMSIGT